MRLLGTALKSLFSRSFTEKYPKKKPDVPKDLKGRLVHDRNKCIYCGLCAKYCPSHAIIVDVQKKTWTHDLGKCLFCAQCEETCHEMPKKDAIKMTTSFELAVFRKNKLITVHKGKAVKSQ